MEPNNDDAAIEEFHAAATRRRRRIMAVTAIVCALIGAAILIVTFTASDPTIGRPRYEVRVIAVGIGFILAAFVSGAMAVRGD